MSQTIAEAFPSAESGVKPAGNKILVQLKSPKLATASGILLTHDSQSTEKDVAAVAKIIALGPLAFRKRDTMEPWTEGVWVAAGDYARVPKWGGDRWEVKVDPANPDPTAPRARFAIYNDWEISSIVTGDPLSFIDYV